MTVIYTQRGFPIDVPMEAGMVYESPTITNLWMQRRGLDKPNFAEDLLDLAIFMNEWKLTGGMFKAFNHRSALTVASTQGFVAETAMLITGKIARRRVGFNDWVLLLAPVAPKDLRPPMFATGELEAIKELADLNPENLFAKWIQVAGLNDLVNTLQLFVGSRDENAR